jgi:hypothetical protein
LNKVFFHLAGSSPLRSFAALDESAVRSCAEPATKARRATTKHAVQPNRQRPDFGYGAARSKISEEIDLSVN